MIFKKVTFFSFSAFFSQLFGYISLARTSSTLLIMSYISEQAGILLIVKKMTMFFPLKYDIALISWQSGLSSC